MKIKKKKKTQRKDYTSVDLHRSRKGEILLPDLYKHLVVEEVKLRQTGWV